MSSGRYPFDWYWLADDGRVFSSQRQLIVDDTDPGYLSFIESRAATQWPRNLAGNQTDDALQAVVADYDMFVNLSFYCFDARWRKEQGGIVLSSGMPIKTDDRAQAKITGVYSAQLEQPAVVTPWHAADNTIHQLDAAQITAMNNELLVHINNCFAVSADVLAGIEAGTITTREQIDAAFGASMTQARRDWLKK